MRIYGAKPEDMREMTAQDIIFQLCAFYLARAAMFVTGNRPAEGQAKSA